MSDRKHRSQSKRAPRLTAVTVAGQTVRMLKDRITWGELAPGTRLIETQLAEDLGVSRTPIRQALQRLEADGLVVRESAGLIVPPFDIEVAVETLLIRELLEPFAAKESAPRLDEPDVARLRSIVFEMEALSQTSHPSPQFGAELNAEFHNLLDSKCGHGRILEVIQVARDSYSALRLYSSYTEEDRRRVHREHLAILDAALAAAGNPDRADGLADLIRDHMRSACLALLRNISDSSSSPETAEALVQSR